MIIQFAGAVLQGAHPPCRQLEAPRRRWGQVRKTATATASGSTCSGTSPVFRLCIARVESTATT